MDIKEMASLSKSYENSLNDIRNKIVDEIKKILSKAELPNVKRISSSPLIITVPSSVVFSNSWNMSAEYYISEAQINLLISKIKNKQTVSEIEHFINTVISDGYIREDSKNKMFINSAVKETLIKISEMLKEN